MTKRRLRRKNKPYKSSNKAKFEGLSVVEVTGFEPATSCSQSRRATGLRYTSLCAPVTGQ